MAETVTAIADGPAGPVPPPPSSFDDLLGDDKTKKLTEDLTKLREEKIKATEEPTKKIEQDRERIEKAYKQVGTSLDDPALRPWNADKELAERTSNPMENFGSFAYIFSIAASAFTKTPLDNALNAMAAYNNAVKKNDEDAYNKAFSAWKENSALALKRHQMQHEQYEDANRLLDTDMNLWRAKLEAAAIRFGDQKALAFLRNGMDREVLETQAASAKAAQEIATARDQLMMAKAKMDYVKASAWDETKQTYNPKKYVEAMRDWDIMENAATPQARIEASLWLKAKEDYAAEHNGAEMPLDEGVKALTKIRQSVAVKPLSPQQEALQRYLAEHPDATAEQIQAFNQLGRAARSAASVAASKYMQEHPEATAEDVANFGAMYAQTVGRARTLGTRSANVDVAIQEAEGAAQQALKTSEAFSRGKWQSINKIKQAIAEQKSSPEMRRFSVANASLITAYSQTMSRTGTNTVTAQNRAMEVLNTADSQEAYAAGVDQLLTEMKIVQQAVKDVEAEGGGAKKIIRYDTSGNRVDQ